MITMQPFLLYIDGRTIYSFLHEKADFEDSELKCIQKGGHLVAIQDESEQTFLLDEMRKR